MLYVVVVLWAFSTPAGPGFVSTAFVVLSPVVLLAAWLVWLAFWASTRRLAQTWRHLLVVPVAGIVVAVLLLLAAPLQIRVALSRGSMDALARQVLAGRPGSLDDRKVGLYHATGIERIRGGMSFRVQETSALTPGGGFASSRRAARAAAGGLRRGVVRTSRRPLVRVDRSPHRVRLSRREPTIDAPWRGSSRHCSSWACSAARPPPLRSPRA